MKDCQVLQSLSISVCLHAKLSAYRQATDNLRWVHTFFLHACQDLDISDIVEFVCGGGAHRVLVHLGGAQLTVHR